MTRPMGPVSLTVNISTRATTIEMMTVTVWMEEDECGVSPRVFRASLLLVHLGEVKGFQGVFKYVKECFLMSNYEPNVTTAPADDYAAGAAAELRMRRESRNTVKTVTSLAMASTPR